jgi:cell division protein FtsW
MHQRGAHFLVMQLIWCGAGLVACVVTAALDYKLYKKLSWLLFGIALVLLILVLHPAIGTWRGGARRWFVHGGVSFQPSEAAKIALIIMLAHYGEHFQRKMKTFWKGLVLPGGLSLLLLIPVYLEPDRGTTILLIAVTIMMLLVAGVRWGYVVIPAILGPAVLALSILYDPMRMARVRSWLNPELTKDGVGYQAWQAMLALGSGGLTGLGLGNGRQKLGFVPEHHTDFIFSIIGEELGLIATLSVVLLFILFVIAGLYIAWRSQDVFGMLLASGITFLIGLQAFINIGVVTSALPNKGLPLPFISYGGSNLVLMLGCVGILLNVARQAQSELEDETARIDALAAEAY